jgi:pilus assembly protein FimV
MSSRLNRVWLVAPFLLLSLQVWALGLGDIRLSSALNEPLRAEIELLAATPEELGNLTVQLASQDTFQRYDLDRPAFLASLQFEVVRSGRADGNIVRVTSTQPITEPFITFLVEATWSRGRLLREYTLLLDPPTFAPPPSTPQTEAVTAPTRAAPADAGQIERPAPRQETPAPAPSQPAIRPPVQAPAETVAEPRPEPMAPTPSPQPAPAEPAPAPQPMPAEPSSQPSFISEFPDDVAVVRGDTLWGITQRVRSDSNLTINQTMLAIYEANPQAFDGNINRLRAGATLRIPPADDIYRIGRSDAYSEVLRQNNEWRGAPPTESFADVEPEPLFEPEPEPLFEPEPEPVPEPVVESEPSLTLVPPDEEDLSLSDTSIDTEAGAEITDDLADEIAADPEERMAQIEAILEDQDALIEIPDNELAALRQELADLRAEAASLDQPTIDDAVSVEDELAADIDAPEVDAMPEPATPTVVTRPAQQDSMVDTILGYLNNFWVWIGAALVVTIAILAWFMRRAAGRDDEDLTGVWETMDAGAGDEEGLASTARLAALARDEEAIVVTETMAEPEMSALADTMETPAAEEPAEVDSLAATDSHAALEMTEAFESPESPESLEMPEAFEMPAAEPEVPAEPEMTAAEPEPAAGATGTQPALDDTFSSETAVNLDQSDPVAEADFHMAYGLYDQAADLINGALSTDPDRQDLLAKLCEIYFVWGNRDAFVDAAERMKTQIGGDSGAEWDKIVIMGQQIAADHELFTGVSAEGVTKAVDLSFEAGMDEDGGLDIDFAGTDDAGGSDVIDLGAVEEAAEEDDDDVVDLSAFSKDDVVATDETGQVLIPPDSGSGIDFSLDEDLAGVEASATHEMPSTEEDGTAEMPVATPTIEEQFTMEATGELPAMTEDEPEPAIPATDATAEIDLDDLGLDLDSLDETAMADDLGGEGEEDTVLGDLDDTASGEALEAVDADQTGISEMLGDLDVTGTNESLTIDAADADDDALDATSTREVLDVEAALEATGEVAEPDLAEDTGATGIAEALPDDAATMLASLDDDDEDTDVGLEANLLDATGQTQILTEDMAVETATELDVSVSDSEATMLAQPLDEDETINEPLSDDAATMLAPTDDEDEGDFDFAKTEALPKDVFSPDMSTDDTGRLPGLAGSTDMDLDLDDLTAALKVSEVGDTVNQIRDDATVEQPRLRPDTNGSGEDTSATGVTQSLAPDDLSDELSEARTMTEVGTKLDLARAYVDMGDPSGARSILEEVLDEGDEGQKQQAQQLIDSLPS